MIVMYAFPILVGVVFGYLFSRQSLVVLSIVSVVVGVIALLRWNQEMELLLSLVIVGMLLIGNVAMWITHWLRSK
jgi:hypothetical protein